MTQTTQGQIIHTKHLSTQVIQITIRPVQYISYSAGQYLQVVHPHYNNLLYSIANAPNGHTYELHIRQNTPLTDELLLSKQLVLTLPFGECTWQKLGFNVPLLLIAGGTGFAPIHAILEQIFLAQQQRPVILIWTVRSFDDLYYHQQLLDLQRQYTFFNYYFSISTQFSLNSFLSTENLSSKITNISQLQVVLAGPFNMVYALRDELLALDVPASQIHSDAFSFENEEK